MWIQWSKDFGWRLCIRREMKWKQSSRAPVWDVGITSGSFTLCATAWLLKGFLRTEAGLFLLVVPGCCVEQCSVDISQLGRQWGNGGCLVEVVAAVAESLWPLPILPHLRAVYFPAGKGGDSWDLSFPSYPSTTLSNYYLQLKEFFIYTMLQAIYPCWTNIRFL